MTDPVTPAEPAKAEPAQVEPTQAEDQPKKDEGSFLWFLVKLVVVVLLLRTFVFASNSIPSDSMMPTLLKGDYLFAAKWPYGYSQASIPGDIELWDGRIFADYPERGDVVTFKHPIDRAVYVKRVIGLPGDQVQMIGGVLHINGEPVERERLEDFLLPPNEQGLCNLGYPTEPGPDDTPLCRYPRFRETLPGGRSYQVLDLGISMRDSTPAVIVPDGMLFMMGDNRDNSQDSRFAAAPGGGVGLVPLENVEARASVVVFSTDGSAEWYNPVSWFTAARWHRVGDDI